MRFVVTGTGRSGTKWCATTLRVGGVHCGHEEAYTTWTLLYDHPVISWNDLEGDASLAATPYLDTFQGRKVLVVRHPLDVAASFARNGGWLAGNQPAAMLSYVRRHHPQVFDQSDELSAAAYYWTVWNTRAAEHADRILLLEDLDAHPADLFDAVGIQPRWPTYPTGPVNTGASGDRPQWDDLAADVRDAAQHVAAQFGY